MTPPTDPGGAPAVEARDVAFSYGDRQALAGVSFAVPRGAVHGFLGPNGSGKSTLFKLLATILPPQQGSLQLLGQTLSDDPAGVRERIGVVFQAPALDRKLSVRRNLRYGGHLQGLRGAELERRIDEVLEIGRLGDRAGDTVGELSGGLRRRVEIAKGLLHRPDVLLLDEPSTGLDPAARQDLWEFLKSQPEVTVLFTTHLMEEADGADRLTILDAGKVVAEGTPDALRREVGAEILEVQSKEAAALAEDLAKALNVTPQVVDDTVRIEHEHAHELVPELVRSFRSRFDKVSLSDPSLEDVFIQKTGHRLSADDAPAEAPKKGRRGRRNH